jgi:predicted RNA-binding Zn ribbon-like protein
MDTPETVRLLGNSLSLDFANSVDWSADREPVRDEVINDPDDLRRWGIRQNLGDSRRPTHEELDRALELRGALHHVFAAIAHDEEPRAADLATIAHHHAEATNAARLTSRDGAYKLSWPKSDARRTRFAVVVDAVALLADAQRLERIRHCPGHNCGWLFLDTSGRRRWCSMDTCGSREKMRRLYARQRAAG